MITPEYRTNRSHFPHVELERYVGTWVAFSSDGRTVVDSAQTLDSLEENLAGRGVDPEQQVFEYVAGPDENIVRSGGELEECFSSPSKTSA